MGRMLRLFRAFPEMTVLVKGISAAVRSVFFTCCLVVIVTYMFAIILRYISYDVTVDGDKYFESVSGAMKHMLIAAIFPDLAHIILAIEDDFDYVGMILFVAFVFLIGLTVMNMMVGILVEV